jgi:hypothetical protein
MLNDETASAGEWQLDLNALPIVPAGQALTDHEVYIDVLIPGHGPIRALPGQTAGSGNGYVAEKDVDAETWDLLVRLDGEARLRQQAQLEAEAEHHHAVDPGITGFGHTE